MNKGTFALTKGFRETRSRSATRNVEMRSTVDEALDFYVKATGMDGAQKRQEPMNMMPGDQRRRSLEHWKTCAEEEDRFRRTKEEAWKLFEKQPESKRKTKEEFEEEFTHKVRNATGNCRKEKEKKMQEWSSEMQRVVQQEERRRETWERTRMGQEDSNSQRRRASEKLREPGAFFSSPCLSSLLQR